MSDLLFRLAVRVCFTFRFSCFSFVNIICLRCLFLISETLKVGGNAAEEDSPVSIFSSLFFSATALSPFSSPLARLFAAFLFFFFLHFLSLVTGTSVKSILTKQFVFGCFVTCSLDSGVCALSLPESQPIYFRQTCKHCKGADKSLAPSTVKEVDIYNCCTIHQKF